MRNFEGSTAYQVSLSRFDRPTRLIERRVSLTTSVVRILDNNPRRLAWIIMNRTASNAAIGFDMSVTYANGLLLAQNGGSMSMSVTEDGEATCYAVYGILEAGTGDFYVIEVIAL